MKHAFLGFLFFSPSVWALTPQEVVSSSLKHYPMVIEAVQQLEVQTNQVTEAKGAFDGKVKGEMNSRVDGFYGGDAYKLGVEKPIPYFNSKIYGGRRQSYGDFPSYEGKLETLNEGENFAGISISLLRNSLIDMNRYNLRYRQQDRQQAQVGLDLVKLNVQTMALKAYWAWLVKGHELKVYTNILELATARAGNIDRRIKVGDLARIYAAENNQYIVKRKAQVEAMNLEFQQASFYLSLFHRNADGKPIPLSSQSLPALDNQKLIARSDIDGIYQRALTANLDLKILDAKEKQAELDIQLGTNEMLPQVDLNYEWSQDRGVGSSTLSQNENRVMLNVEIPIQYRKGAGKRRAGKAKLEQVKVKSQFTKEKVRVEVQSLVAKINAFAEIFNLTSEQVELSNKLADAERKKFFRGASDLILVNIREENLAEAQVKNLEALLKYHFVDADLRNVQVDFLK